MTFLQAGVTKKKPKTSEKFPQITTKPYAEFDRVRVRVRDDESAPSFIDIERMRSKKST